MPLMVYDKRTTFRRKISRDKSSVECFTCGGNHFSKCKYTGRVCTAEPSIDPERAKLFQSEHKYREQKSSIPAVGKQEQLNFATAVSGGLLYVEVRALKQSDDRVSAELQTQITAFGNLAKRLEQQEKAMEQRIQALELQLAADQVKRAELEKKHESESNAMKAEVERALAAEKSATERFLTLEKAANDRTLAEKVANAAVEKAVAKANERAAVAEKEAKETKDRAMAMEKRIAEITKKMAALEARICELGDAVGDKQRGVMGALQMVTNGFVQREADFIKSTTSEVELWKKEWQRKFELMQKVVGALQEKVTERSVSSATSQPSRRSSRKGIRSVSPGNAIDDQNKAKDKQSKTTAASISS